MRQHITDPDELRERHRQVQAGLSNDKSNWTIRVHRAISWYAKAMAIAGRTGLRKDFDEARLLFLWISLSCLFSRWDTEQHHPAPEGNALQAFVDQLLRMDQGRLIVDCVGQNKATIRRLIANPFLHMEFWLNPFSQNLPEKLLRHEGYFSEPLTAETAGAVLRDVLYRVYMLRGQVVHGASTAGSHLNRQTISDSIQLLQSVIPLVIGISIDGGINVEWPALCYPPTDINDPEQLRQLTKRM